MERPLSAGDVCIIINGLSRTKSPNIGKIVTIDKRVFGAHGMDHSQYGPVYKCIGQELWQLGDNGEFFSVTSADIPGIWLKRIDPPKLNKAIEKVMETEK